MVKASRSAAAETQRRTYKYRLEPNKTTIAWLEQTFETHRRLYNDMLAWRIHAYEVYGKAGSMSYVEQQNALTRIRRNGHEFYQRCPVDSLHLTLDRLDKAFKNFFRRVKAGGPPGFPRFQGRDRWDSIAFPANTNQPPSGVGWRGKGIAVDPPTGESKKGTAKLTVMEAGEVTGHHVARIVWHRPLPDDHKIKQASIVREGTKWFICLSMEVPTPAPSCGTGLVGVDVGLKAFVTTSTGSTLGTTTLMERSLAELRRRQRALARCKKGSNRRRKKRADVARLHRLVANTRKHEHYNVAKTLFDQYDTVAVESLNVQGMMKNSSLARRIADAGWSSFIEKLNSTAAKRGGNVVAVPAAGTTQECSGCGEVVPKDLSVRVHKCPHCGLVLDRDENAARNIAQRAEQLRNTGGGHPAGGNVAGCRKRSPRIIGKSAVARNKVKP